MPIKGVNQSDHASTRLLIMSALAFVFARLVTGDSKKTGIWQWTTLKERPGMAVLQSLTVMEVNELQNLPVNASHSCFQNILNSRQTPCSQSRKCSSNSMTNSWRLPAKTVAQTEPPACLALYLTVDLRSPILVTQSQPLRTRTVAGFK